MFWGDVNEVWRKESQEHPKLEMIRMLIEKQANSACTRAQPLTPLMPLCYLPSFSIQLHVLPM